MSDDIAPGVKSILKAIDSGIKLGKRVARSSVYAPAAQVLQISESAQKLQKSLEASSKAIKNAYNESVGICGAPFVNALLDECKSYYVRFSAVPMLIAFSGENNQLKELRIDLIDQTDKCQDFDENPLLFDPTAFTNVQQQAEKCCTHCISIFSGVRERLLAGRHALSREGQIDDREQLSSMRQNRDARAREASMRDASVRKPVPSPSRHIGQLQITPPRPAKPRTPWTLENSSNYDIGSPVSAVSSLTTSLGVSPRSMGPPTLRPQNSRDVLLPSPATAQGTQLIPWELVHSRITTNDEFLERRRQSRVSFQNELRRSINSIEEDRASEVFSDGVMSSPITGIAEMPGSQPVERHGSRTSSNGYDELMSRQRSQGQASQATRSSEGSFIYPLTPPMSENSTMGSLDQWTAVSSTIEFPAPSYSESAAEQGLEVVADLSEKDRLAAHEKANEKAEKLDNDTGKEMTYDAGLETTFETGKETKFDLDNEKMVSVGNEKMLVAEEQSFFQSTPAASLKSVDHPMRHDSSFYKMGGFCEGARLIMRGETGFKVVKRPSVRRFTRTRIL